MCKTKTRDLYNIDLLLENADTLTVALHIGIEVVTKGRYNYITCPGHLDYMGKYDNKISNAILTEKGYHCFACSRSVGLIDMVREYYKNYLSIELDFVSALEIIAETCGGKEMYLISKNDSINSPIIQRNVFILNKQELEFIGLSTSGNNIIITNSKKEYNMDKQKKYRKHFKFDDNKNDFNVEYLEYYNEPESIYTFYNEDKINCLELMLRKVMEKQMKIRDTLDIIDNFDITTLFNNSLIQDKNTLVTMKDILLKDILTCSSIEKKLRKEYDFYNNEINLEETKEENNIIDDTIYKNLYNIDNIKEEGPLFV